MKSRPSVPCTRFLPAILALLMFSAAMTAQSPAGRLRGQITDPSGAVIPGATISLKNASGLTIPAKSDGAGNYDVRNLAPGKYAVSVSAKGFRPYTATVEIAAGQDKSLDFPLQIATQEEKVVVESESAKVSVSSDNNASTVVLSGKDLDALSDDPDELQSELLALAGPSAGPNGGQIYIDGFTGGQLPPKSSIREIRINQNPFSAQYDRMGFGRIEILTKPGTDKPHGQLSYNDNHSLFDARNPFGARDAFGNVVEPDFSSEIVSGNAGGPLSKRASYFVSAERRDIHDAAVISTDAFSSAGLAPQAVLNPRVRSNISTRFDYQLLPSNTLMVRYQFTKNHEENNGVGQLSLPSLALNQDVTEHQIQISDTQILSPRAINETRFEWEHENNRQNSLTLTPTISVLGSFTEGGNPQGVSHVISDHFELQNYTSLNVGRHFIRFGGRLRATANSTTSTQNFNGTFTFGATIDPITKQQISSAVQNFQAGKPSQFTLVAGNPLIDNTFVDAGFYAEDDFKFRPNMTLSYGLRLETQNGIQDHSDFAPRVGFAWGLGGTKNTAPKTVIRTGFGIFYDRFQQGNIMTTKRLNGINQQQYTLNNQTPANQTALNALYAAYPALPSPASLAAVGVATYSLAPNLRTPYTMQAAASVERQLTKASTLTVTYLHSQGLHQLFSVNTNALIANATPAYEYLSEGIFRQNQLITSFNMRMGARLSLFSYYSLSYANSDTGGAGSFPSNPALGISADYGRAAFDVRNRLFFGGTFSLPHGFRVSPFLVANSGPPFNITTGQDLNGDSIFNDRPAFSASGKQTEWGTFDSAPAPGDPRIPMNLGTTPAQFTANVRLSKTFGLGPKLETAANNTQPQGGQRPGGDGGRGPGGPGGGGHGPGGGGPGGGGPGGGGRGPGGPMGGIFNPERSSQRYSLTFSANARNLFNKVNAAPPIGNLSSPDFGRSTALAGGPFNTQSANRRIDFQVVFAF
jgi:hypothetical protein